MEEVINEPTTSLNSDAVKTGVILGIISIFVTIIVYVANPALLVSMWFGLSMLVVGLIFVIYMGIRYRNSTVGYMSFGQAFRHGFIAFVVSAFIGTLFTIILHTLIDPDLKNFLTDKALENQESMMRGFGAPQDKIDEALVQARERTAKQYTPVGYLLQFGIGIIIWAIVSLITGLIVKKRNPEEVI